MKEVVTVQPGASALAIPDTRSDAAVATPTQTFVYADMRNPPSVKESTYRRVFAPNRQEGVSDNLTGSPD